jgi:hypothetical protein
MSKTMLSAMTLAFAATVGCHHAKTTPPPPASTPPAAPVSVGEINASKLQFADVPQPVRTVFNKDHPSAAIQNIKMSSTSAGMSFYEISYISDGQGGIAKYYSTGATAP